MRVTADLVAAAKAAGKPEPKGDPSKLRIPIDADKEKALLEKWKAK